MGAIPNNILLHAVAFGFGLGMALGSEDIEQYSNQNHHHADLDRITGIDFASRRKSSSA